MPDFRKLLVWEKAHALMVAVHHMARGICRSYDLALRSQMNRAALSIPTNIVEGRRQASDVEFARFLRIALNSGFELEYHLIAARDVGAISVSESDRLISQVIEVRRMLHGLIRSLTNPQSPGYETRVPEQSSTQQADQA
jgi:four helix bundle protein